MFVFGALLEYAFVSYQDSNRQSERAKEQAVEKQRKKRQKLEMVDAEIYQPPCTCHLVSYSSMLQQFANSVQALSANI